MGFYEAEDSGKWNTVFESEDLQQMDNVFESEGGDESNGHHNNGDDNILSAINLRPNEETKIKLFLNENLDVKAEVMNVTSAYIAFLKRDLETYEVSSHIGRPISLSKMVNDLRKETQLFGEKLLNLFSPLLPSIPKLKQIPGALQGIIDTIMEDHQEKMKKHTF